VLTSRYQASRKPCSSQRFRSSAVLCVWADLWLSADGFPVRGQDSTSEWQAQVRKYAQAQDWDSALRVVDREIARAPRTWTCARGVRAFWPGREDPRRRKRVSGNPESVAKRSGQLDGSCECVFTEGKTEEALRALDVAVELDPKRADLHAARARALRATESEAKLASNFRKLWIWIPPTQKRTPGCYRRATSQDTHYGSAKATTSLISRGQSRRSGKPCIAVDTALDHELRRQLL